EHLSAIRGDDRVAGQRGQVETEVSLLVDVLSFVDVRALIGEGGFDRAVREGMENHAAPEHFRRGLFGEGRDLLGVLLAELAVDHEELGEVVAFGLDLARALENGGDDAIEELVVYLDAALLE